MARLNIQFQGICTQIKLPEPIGNVPHRVVMVHAEAGKVLEGHWIPPHSTFLMINGADIVEGNIEELDTLRPMGDGNWQMLGTRLRVKEAVGKVEYDESMTLVPSLTELAPDFGALSQEVVYGSDAAGHFDVSSGRFSAETMSGGAYYCTLQVETSVNGNVVLEIQDLGLGKTGSFTLKSGSTIVVSNTGGKLRDTEWDFLLHFLTAQTFPAHPALPLAPLRPSRAVKMYEPLGPGCSNSNYP